MKKLKYKFLILSIFSTSNLLFSHHPSSELNSSEFQVFKAFGDAFEPLFSTHANNITAIFTVFATLFGTYITFIAITAIIKMNKIEATIESNRETIQDIKTDVTEKINYIEINTKVNIDDVEKWFIDQTSQISRNTKDDIKDLKNRIEDIIMQEISASSKQLLRGIEEHLYRKVELRIEEIKKNTQKRLFNYQELIYKVNQLKKINYDLVLSQSLSLEEKLPLMVNIQNRYNETNNITIPNLLSDDVDKVLLPALKKLSDDKELFNILIKYFKNILEQNDYSYSEKSKIKDALIAFYNYDYDQDKKTEKEKNNY